MRVGARDVGGPGKIRRPLGGEPLDNAPRPARGDVAAVAEPPVERPVARGPAADGGRAAAPARGEEVGETYDRVRHIPHRLYRCERFVNDLRARPQSGRLARSPLSKAGVRDKYHGIVINASWARCAC